MSRIKQAVLLVGGKGRRLSSLTRVTPKPMLEIAPGMRFIDVLLTEVSRHGFDDIILLAGHLGEQFETAYHGRRINNARIRVFRESEPLGTGGALTNVSKHLDPWFLLMNGDSFFDINMRALTASTSPDFLGQLALRRVRDVSRYGEVRLAGDLITEFREKGATTPMAGLINAGLYLLSRKFLDQITNLPCSIERDLFPKLAHARALRGMPFNGYFLDIGLPESFGQAQQELLARRSKPAAFLDRDGVLNVDHGYTYRRQDLEWIAGARDAVRLLNETGHYVIVVSNQSGIGRCLYTIDDVNAFHSLMQDQLAEIGAHIDAFYYCPFHAEARLESYRYENHPDRKPNPGMIVRALREWPIEPSQSFLIGDKPSDIEAAQAAGIHGFLCDSKNLLDLIVDTRELSITRTSVADSDAEIRE